MNLVTVSVEADAVQAIQDAIANHNVWVGVAGGAVLIAVIVAKVLGKEIPLLDSVGRAVLGIVRKQTGEKVEPFRAPDSPDSELNKVVDIKPLPTEKGPQP